MPPLLRNIIDFDISSSDPSNSRGANTNIPLEKGDLSNLEVD
jgi:hypothetical protein